MIRRPAVLALALAAASAGGVQSWVKVHQWDRSDVPVHFRLALHLQGSDIYNSAAAEALDAWNRAGAAFTFTFTFTSSVEAPLVRCSADASRLVVFAARVCGGEFPSGTLAVTNSWVTDSGRVVDSDVLFNTGYSWDVYGGRLRYGAQDLRRVALHEFGHVLGLDHPDERGQTRQAIMNTHVSDLDALQTDDVNGIVGIYGAASGDGGVCSLEDLGLLTGRVDRSGSLGNDCVSPNHTGEFSRFYTFRLREAADIRIDMRSPAFDAYLELRAGADMFGELLAFDDDGSGRDARIEHSLSAGTYTIEATSFDVGVAGPFTLTAR